MKKILILLSIIALSGCSTIIPQTKVIEVPEIDPSLPQPLQMQPVNWKVYASNDFKQFINLPDLVLFTLTEDEVKKLASNQLEQERYILQLKQDVLYYRSHNAFNNQITK